MKKIILGLIVVTLFGCEKVAPGTYVFPRNKKEDVVTQPIPTANTKIEKLPNGYYFGKTSYELRASQMFINIDSIRSIFGIRSIGEFSGNNNLGFVYVDMNNDGFEDIFYPYSTGSEVNLKPEVFINLGNKYVRDNSMLPNDYVGNQVTRKTLVGDFNNDSLPDLFLINSGYENVKTQYFALEKNTLLLSDRITGKYKVGNLPMLGKDFWHGGASGDLNGDGNIDIVVSSGKPVLLLGNGKGEFTKQNVDFKNDNSGAFITIEITDVDKNGTNDIIMSGDEGQRNNNSIAKSNILLNNNLTFQKVDITEPNTLGWKLVMNIGCGDIDGDGINEIFLCRTSSSVWYNGYNINIFKRVGNGYADVSDKFIKNNKYVASDRNGAGFWMYQMNLKKERDGLYSINAYVTERSTVQYWKQNPKTKIFE
jgi:hypothetical protein